MKNYYSSKSMTVSQAALILIAVPSFIWLILGLIICYINSLGIFEIYAVFFPTLIIFATYFIAIKFNSIGGLLLTFEGLLMLYVFITHLTISQNIPMILLFAAPLTLSGILFMISNTRASSFTI